MPIVRAGGYANYSSEGTNKFTPELYSGKLVSKAYATTVSGSICTTAYEGEIKAKGDKVNIRKVPTILPLDYTIGQDIVYTVPEEASTVLEIDKAIYASPAIDKIDAFQSDIALIENWTTDMARQFAIRMDRDLLADIPGEVAAANQGATAGAISGNVNLGAAGASVQINSENAVQFILRMGQVLDEQNVSHVGRWLVLPSWYIAQLKDSLLRDASVTGDGTSPSRNGKVGMVDRFTIYQSNLLSVVDDGGIDVTQVLGGHADGLAWATQFTDLSLIELESKIGFGMRMVATYGYKAIEPKYLALGRVRLAVA